MKLLPPDDSQQFMDVGEIISDPDLMIYRRIEHQFDCDGSLQWFKGTILGFDKDTKEYRVQYDNEDEIYSFPLLDDLRNNELHVLR